MHRISRRMVAVVVVIGAIAAGGAAFTASNTVSDSVAGYGTSNITGATATDVHYTLSADGTDINTVLITFTGDLSSRHRPGRLRDRRPHHLLGAGLCQRLQHLDVLGLQPVDGFVGHLQRGGHQQLVAATYAMMHGARPRRPRSASSTGRAADMQTTS